jgi:hypothetical protein
MKCGFLDFKIVMQTFFGFKLYCFNFPAYFLQKQLDNESELVHHDTDFGRKIKPYSVNTSNQPSDLFLIYLKKLSSF